MPHILLTGDPRIGKTTLLREIIKDLESCGGFYTEEIISNDKRIGFKIKTLGGKEGILAKEGLKGKYKLGKYGIDLTDLEEIGIKAIDEALKEREIIVIDEIGKMEFFSKKFKKVVFRALDSEKMVVGVIHRNLLELVNSRKDVKILEVNLNNYEEVLKNCRALLHTKCPVKQKSS